MGIWHFSTRVLAVAAASASRDRPGPIASTVFPLMSSYNRVSAFSEIAPAAVSESGSVINSGWNPATVARTDFGVATVDNPAPDRSTDIPAIAAAPALPSEPPMTRTCPYLPLLESTGRGASSGAMSRAVITFSCSDETMASSGEPMSATYVDPLVSELNTCAGRGAVNVTTASERAIVPDGGRIASASAPEGISTEITGV